MGKWKKNVNSVNNLKLYKVFNEKSLIYVSLWFSSKFWLQTPSEKYSWQIIVEISLVLLVKNKSHNITFSVFKIFKIYN